MNAPLEQDQETREGKYITIIECQFLLDLGGPPDHPDDGMTRKSNYLERKFSIQLSYKKDGVKHA